MNIIIAFLISVLTLFTVPPYVSYNNNSLTIDTPIADLNGDTLREYNDSYMTLSDTQLFEYSEADLGTGFATSMFSTMEYLPNGVVQFSGGFYGKITSNIRPTINSVSTYYIDSRIRVASGVASFISIESINIFDKVLNPEQDLWYNLRYSGTIIQNPINIFASFSPESNINGSFLQIDYFRLYDVSYFIENDLYSPLYDLPFGDLTSEQIYAQMSDFVDNPESFKLYVSDKYSYLTSEQIDYYNSLYQSLLTDNSLNYLDYDLHDIALIIFFGFLWLSLIILLKRKVLI